MHLNSFGFSYSNLGDTMHSVNTTARTPSKHYYKKNIKISSHRQAQIQQNILLYVSALSPIFFLQGLRGVFFSRGWSRVWITPHEGRKKHINFLQCTNLIFGDVFLCLPLFRSSSSIPRGRRGSQTISAWTFSYLNNLPSLLISRRHQITVKIRLSTHTITSQQSHKLRRL